MLSPVLQELAARRWFDTTRPYQMSVHLTQGACVWLLLSRDGLVDTHVKFSDCLSLHEEAARCAAAHACYPALVPRFVGHARTGPLELLVSRAVDYRGVDSNFLLDARPRARAADDLVAYFEAMPQALAPAGAQALANEGLIAALQAYFGTHRLAALAQRWLDRGLAERLAALPALPQHGDLVLNNLGRTGAGRLVIFDWEDFGAVSLPGLDLFTLELALCGDARRLLARRAAPGGPLANLVQRCCAALQLSLADYQQLTPLYALVFRWLKRNYGPGVRERMDQLLCDLDPHLGRPQRPPR